MKNRKALAVRLMNYCAEHHILYHNSSSYPNTLVSATKRDLRTSNGMLYHMPRLSEWQQNRLKSGWMDDADTRVYLLWFEEPFDQVVESLAYLKLMTNRHIMLLSCQKRNLAKRAPPKLKLTDRQRMRLIRMIK